MRSLTTLFAAVAAVAALASTGCVVHERAARPAEVRAMRDGHVFLGARWVRGNGGQAVHEAIGGLARDGRFTSIMLVVEHAPVELFDVVITFGDGERFRPDARFVFGPDTTTREIPLPGGARIIRRVDFVFANLPGDGRARVELWAR